MKQLFKITSILIISVFISGCKNTEKRTISNGSDSFMTGEYELIDNVFGDIIELTGKNILKEVLFTFSETELLVHDSILILKNNARGNTHIIQLFKLPDMELMTKIGNAGRGPLEFSYSAHIIPTPDTSALIYLYNRDTREVYKVTKSLSLEMVTSKFNSLDMNTYFIENIMNLSESKYFFTERTREKNTLLQLTISQDNTSSSKLIDLNFNPNVNTSMAYFGYFAMNIEKNRFAYAYRYYRRILFSDLNADSIRVVKFNAPEYDPLTDGVADGENLNTAYYHNKAASGEKYIYFTYLGKKVEEISKEQNNGVYTQYLEVWDWNGNPIRKFKLDQFGHITVDEKNNKLYLVSREHEYPFFVYDLELSN